MSNLYSIGEIPAAGAIPERMHAWVIRREIMPVPMPGPGEVLVQVMAAGVNYNGVWASLGQPLSVLDVHKQDFHIAGSDASGVVWAVGPGVRNCKPGDEVVLH